MGRTRRLAKWCAATAVVLATAAPAPAFYWKGWPSMPPAKIDQTILPPGVGQPGTPVANPAFPGGDQDHPPAPVTPPPPPPPPEHVPEPATGIAGLIGLGVLAARKWRKR
jgi:hypothetical protein